MERRDEDNLEENERIKQELNPRKIDEPKTPYLSPLQTEDEQEETLGTTIPPSHCQSNMYIQTRFESWMPKFNTLMLYTTTEKK